MSIRVVRAARVALATLAACLLPFSVAAQGTVSGVVRGNAGVALSGVQLSLSGTGFGGLSDESGAFSIQRVPAGTYTLEATSLGYQPHTATDVRVRNGESTRVEVTLTGAAISLGGFVVSASRGAEKVTDAPASITRIDPGDIDLSVGNNFVGALKEVKGLDYIQVGSTTAAINARGFNSSFNNRMLMVVDGRVSVLPESGLPIGQFTTVPKLDLAGIEVLVGPGAALYGADASNGVLTLQTKDPFQYQGTTVEIAGGNRSYKDVQFRHADVHGSLGYKITGEWQKVNDWENRLTYVSSAVDYPEIGVDFTSEVQRVSGSLVDYAGANRIELSGGYSRTDGVGQTNVGRNQFDGWTYNFAQLTFSRPHLWMNLYRNQSQAGKSYAINRYSVNRIVMSGLTDKEVKLESDWPSNGRLYGAELQTRYTVEPLKTDFVWGAQYRHDVVSSDREWLTDRFTGEDLGISTYGVYGQLRSALSPKLDLVVAARYDNHDNYDAQFSPKAGLVFKPAEDQSLRVTFNKAFKSPTVLQTNFWIPDFVPFVGVFGNTEGFTVRDGSGATVASYEPIEPEKNTTWEVGYKGVLGDRVYLDATWFRSRYTNFFSPLITIANPFAGTSASFGSGTAPILSGAGRPQVVLTYFNLGEATLNGFDVGADVKLSEYVSASATVSVLDLSTVEAPATAAGTEATALNSPTTKWTLGLDARNIGRLTGGLTLRHVTGYDFRSGINIGNIPTFNTLDLALSTKLGESGARLNFGVNNLFTCRASNPAKGDTGSACGFGEEHMEMVNMPSVGTNVFVGLRYHVR